MSVEIGVKAGIPSNSLVPSSLFRASSFLCITYFILTVRWIGQHVGVWICYQGIVTVLELLVCHARLLSTWYCALRGASTRIFYNLPLRMQLQRFVHVPRRVKEGDDVHGKVYRQVRQMITFILLREEPTPFHIDEICPISGQASNLLEL